MGVTPSLLNFQVPGVFGPDAVWIQQESGYAEAKRSASEALFDLYNRTKDARVGRGKHGPEFRYDLGKHFAGIGFIDEEKTAAENGMPFPVAPNSIGEVVKLGSDVKGKGTLREVRDAVHNFEKLNDPQPRLLRDFNWERAMLVIFWVNKNLWLMPDGMISTWTYLLSRLPGAKHRGITAGAVGRTIRELGLKRSQRPLVKQIISWDSVIFDTPVKP